MAIKREGYSTDKEILKYFQQLEEDADSESLHSSENDLTNLRNLMNLTRVTT